MIKLIVNSDPGEEALTPGTDAYKKRQRSLSYCWGKVHGMSDDQAARFAETHVQSGRDISLFMVVERRYHAE